MSGTTRTPSKKVGGTILQSDPQRWVNGKIVKDGQEVWVQAEKGNGVIWLRIVEKKEMEQFIEADAAAFGNDIRATGHAAVYGINFDTGKSTIKPESAQAIGEIAKLLKPTRASRSMSWATRTTWAAWTATSSSPRSAPRPSSRRSSATTASPPPA